MAEIKIGKVKGEDGITPHIGGNGNWWIGDEDTGVNSSGASVVVNVELADWVSDGAQFKAVIPQSKHGLAASSALMAFTKVYVDTDATTQETYDSPVISNDGTVTITSNHKWQGVCVIAGGMIQTVDGTARAEIAALSQAIAEQPVINAHINNTGNPHGTTPAQIGAATAAQGLKADGAVQRNGDTMTGPLIVSGAISAAGKGLIHAPAIFQGNIGDWNDTGFRIDTPIHRGSSWMGVITIRVYSAYEYMDISFSGYAYAAQMTWYAPKAVMVAGTRSAPVRMGVLPNDNLYVWVGGGTAWSGAQVLNVTSTRTIVPELTGWGVVHTNDCPNVAFEGTIHPPYSPNNPPPASGASEPLFVNTYRIIRGGSEIIFSVTENVDNAGQSITNLRNYLLDRLPRVSRIAANGSYNGDTIVRAFEISTAGNIMVYGNYVHTYANTSAYVWGGYAYLEFGAMGNVYDWGSRNGGAVSLWSPYCTSRPVRVAEV